MENFKVIIAGGRDFNDYALLKNKCDYFLKSKRNTHNVIIVSGHARGADSLGEKYAIENGLDTIIKPAEWDKYGKSAGYKRNIEMANIADAVIAFWDRNSKGTKHMIDTAIDRKLPLKIVTYNK